MQLNKSKIPKKQQLKKKAKVSKIFTIPIKSNYIDDCYTNEVKTCSLLFFLLYSKQTGQM